MLDSALRVQKLISGRTFDQFIKDETLQEAVLWRFAVIGEAAGKIQPATRAAFPSLPFSEMVKMRNILAHVYWGINHQIVWDTATRDVPELIKHLSAWFAAKPGGTP
ncbi:MAG TPA: HepT-like ribonuclease domain-containing protein [Tepidisphaeraceae bacterium]|nr:HepT-like ribonuclease domain-containing protein [Tepidisphaeraceae bacterium]